MAKWKKKNKTSEVLNYLQLHGSIDSITAIREFGATRLSAIIYNLRYKYNMNIRTENVEFTDRYGTPSDYAKYVLVKED